ncbi:MAG: nickel-dependent lactate racemase [Chloroflexi bacterium]|nr:nickel-dependent lactate racemase [Chloroflexota bacterium]
MTSEQTIRLACGNDYLTAHLPEQNLSGVFSPKPVPPCSDPVLEIKRALAQPLDCPPLSQLVKPADKVVILIDDHTRTTPADLILPHVLQELDKIGCREEDITILITHGTHRLSTEEEVRKKVGEEIFHQYKIVQHRCEDEQNQVFLGITSRGTPVWINRLVYEADKRIGIGHIGLSPYAGFSGGLKLIIPGAAALDTINCNHSMVPLGFRKPGDTRLPTRLDIDEAAGMIGMDFILDVVLDANDKIIKAFAGASAKVYQEGVALARTVFEVACPSMVDIAITSAYPYDIDLYQAVRAVEYADAIVREGGSILLVAACPDGWGGEDFRKLMCDRTKTPPDFLRDIARRNGKVTFSVLGYALSRIKSEKRLVIPPTNIPATELEEAGFYLVNSLQEGIEELIEKYGAECRIAVFPSGSVTVPCLL